MINQFVKLVTGTGIGTLASILNIQQMSNTYDIVDFHIGVANGVMGLVIGGFTLTFLYYQICKIKKDLKNKK